MAAEVTLRLAEATSSLASEVSFGDQRYVISACSARGPRRIDNQDNWRYGCLQDDVSRQPRIYAMVADGVGGRPDGKFASTQVVKSLTQALAGRDAGTPLTLEQAVRRAGNDLRLANHLRSVHREALDTRPADDAPEHLLQRAGDRAKDLLIDADDYQAPATTVVAALIEADRLHLASVGDSCIYRIRQQQLSRTLSGDSGPGGGLTQWMGKRDMAVRTAELPNAPGDVLILCSDGLTRELTESTITQVILRHQERAQHHHSSNRAEPTPAEQLVELALNNNARDNVTVIVIESLALTAAKRRSWSALITVSIVIAVLALILAVTWFFPN